MKRSKTLFLLWGFMLIWTVSVQGKSKLGWNGKYLHVNGIYELSIEQWSENGISVTIARKGNSQSDAADGFLAFIKGDTAEHRDIAEPNGCRMVVKRQPAGVALFDYCGGSKEQAGFYKKE